MAQAWMTAALGRARNLPTLEALMRGEKRPPTAEELAEMREAHERMTEELGAE